MGLDLRSADGDVCEACVDRSEGAGGVDSMGGDGCEVVRSF